MVEIVSDAEVRAATPEQLLLVSKFYLLSSRKGAEFVRNAVVGAVRATTASVDTTLTSNGQLNAKYAPRVDPTNSRVAGDLSHNFPTSFDKTIQELGLLDKETIDGYVQRSLGVSFKDPNSQFNTIKAKYELGIKDDTVVHRFANPSRGDEPQIDHVVLQDERANPIKQLEDPAAKPPTGGASAPGINWKENFANMGISAAMGAGIGAVFSIPMLLRGEYANFFIEVGVNGGMGAAAAGISRVISSSLGEAAGPVAVIILGTLVDTVGLCKSGDWSRFGKNMGINIGATAVGFAGAKGGAFLGGAIGSIVPGIGTAIGATVGGVVGGIGGALFGRKILAKTGLGSVTKAEKRQIARAKETYLKEKIAEVNKGLSSKGLKLPDELTPKEFEAMLHDEQIKLQFSNSWEKLPGLTGAARDAYHGAIKAAFILARLCSSRGDITDGLRTMVLMLGGTL